ncbi:hypothetical protein ARZXY2_2251 [Arthrobacter sp. ZXY-2]|nr:hypothetical protein ARZXY2_2251 [Arthrobacter sp. ZXY-2]
MLAVHGASFRSVSTQRLPQEGAAAFSLHSTKQSVRMPMLQRRVTQRLQMVTLGTLLAAAVGTA